MSNALRAESVEVVLSSMSSLPEGTEVKLIPAESTHEVDAEERARLPRRVDSGAQVRNRRPR